MYVYIYIYICMYIYVYLYIYTYINKYKCVCICVFHTNVCMCMCDHIERTHQRQQFILFTYNYNIWKNCPMPIHIMYTYYSPFHSVEKQHLAN